MKRFIAMWLLSWADLIDTVVELFIFGLVLRTNVAHVVLRNAEAAFFDNGWIEWHELARGW